MHREPDTGLDPGTPGSRPGPKAGAKSLRHPGIPASEFLTGFQGPAGAASEVPPATRASDRVHIFERSRHLISLLGRPEPAGER